MRDQIEVMMKSGWTFGLLGIQQTAHLLTTGQFDSPAVQQATAAARNGLDGVARMALTPGEMVARTASMMMMPVDPCTHCGEQGGGESQPEAKPQAVAKGWGGIPRMVAWESMPVTPVNTTGWGPSPS